jgi:hypothetical protein
MQTAKSRIVNDCAARAIGEFKSPQDQQHFAPYLTHIAVATRHILFQFSSGTACLQVMGALELHTIGE